MRKIGLLRLIRPIGLILVFAAAAARAETLPVLQSNFTGGELSPLAAARVDAERYYRSAATLENMIALPKVRRSGGRGRSTRAKAGARAALTGGSFRFATVRTTATSWSSPACICGSGATTGS